MFFVSIIDNPAMPDLACEKTLNKITKGIAVVNTELLAECVAAVLR